MTLFTIAGQLYKNFLNLMWAIQLGSGRRTTAAAASAATRSGQGNSTRDNDTGCDSAEDILRPLAHTATFASAGRSNCCLGLGERHGDFFSCNKGQLTGFSFQGHGTAANDAHFTFISGNTNIAF
jgi:hypothetical protein